MEFEHLAAPPPSLSPQMRYAALHRSIESGIANDRSWSQLIDVCLEMGRMEEAIASFHRLDEPGVRRRMLSRLHTRGLMREAELAPDGSLRQRRSSRESGVRGSPHSEAGPDVPSEVPRSSLGELVGDAFRFLFLDHMPLTVIVATVTFPLVIGLGGFLTASVGPSAYFAMSLLALVPAASALALVGALARNILLDANRGLIDPPAVPTFGRLLGEAMRFGGDVLVLGSVFLGPSIALACLGESGLAPSLAAFAVLGSLLPMAIAMRSTREDWSALQPRELLGEVRRLGSRYFGVALVIGLLLAPAFIALLMTLGSQAYMSLSVVGPLTVAPLFVAARLLGHVLYESRREERRLATVRSRSTTRRRAAGRPAAAGRQQAEGRSRAAATARKAPGGNVVRGTRGRRVSTAQPHPEARGQAPERRRVAGGPRPPQPGSENQPPLRRRNQPAAAPVAASAGAGSGEPRRMATRQPDTARRVGLDSEPDLTGLPGASVFRGAERVAAGAAARDRNRK